MPFTAHLISWFDKTTKNWYAMNKNEFTVSGIQLKVMVTTNIFIVVSVPDL